MAKGSEMMARGSIGGEKGSNTLQNRRFEEIQMVQQNKNRQTLEERKSSYPKFSQQVPLAESVKLTAFNDDSICSNQSPDQIQPNQSYDKFYDENRQSSEYVNSFDDPNPLKKSQLIVS